MKWRKLHKAVWMDPRLRAQEPDVRCVLADLTMLCEDTGDLHEHIDDLAAMARASPARFREIITILERLELIETAGDRITVYSVQEDHAYTESRKHGGLAAKENLKQGRKRQKRHFSKDAGSDAGADAGKMPGPMPGTMPGESPASSSGTSGASNSLPFTTDEFSILWSRWRKFRKEKKKPLTEEQESTQLAKLAKEGLFSATHRIERSIANGWQGLWMDNDPEVFTPANVGGTKGSGRGRYEPEPVLYQDLDAKLVHERALQAKNGVRP